MLRQLLRKKSIETLLAEMAGEERLHRVLGPISLTALGVGAIIGAGIFVTTGRAAADDAGPAILVSYTVAALGCAFAALCYAEFSAMAPVAGSAYTYAYATLGELFAWIIGWDLMLEYAMSCATVASAWSGYWNEFLQSLHIPRVAGWLSNDPFSYSSALEPDGPLQLSMNLPAVLIMLLITAVLVRGIRESATTNAALVIVKLAVVLFVVAIGWSYINRDNWTSIPIAERHVPADPASKWGMLGLLGLNEWLVPIDEKVRSPFAPYGLSGIMLGASIVFFAYIGFDSISTHAEEAKQPKRDVPFAILTSLALCTVLYIAVSAVITGMVPYPTIDAKAPIAVAFADKAAHENSGALHVATGIIAAGGLAGMTSVLLVTFLSQVRVFMAMARDGLLPPIFGHVHPKFRTPHLATMLTGAIICVICAFTPIKKLEEMVNIGTLMAFVVVCASVLILRVQRPSVERPFRCPMIYAVAPLGILVNLVLMLFLPWDTWLRLAVWLAVGLAIYFAYSRFHSKLSRETLNELKAQGLSPTDAPLKRQ
ncbi:MAG: amino acid permease [Planctomycetia bacterium]|nr:amino acid permease [Planctomycetia bacterium]